MKEDAVKTFRTIYEGDNETLQESLLALKKMGCTQIETIKFLMVELGISLREADAMLLNSTAWKAEKDDTLKLRDSFGEALSE